MSTRPRISVVVPCFNHAAFVGAAIQSVLDQTFEDFELVVIDDASADETPSILSGFRDPRVRLTLSRENRGAHATLNLGIEQARGELVTILNSDDVFAKSRLADLLATKQRTGADVIGTDIALIGRDGRALDDADHYWNRWFSGLKAHLATHGDIARTLATGNLFITTSNLFAEKRVIERVGPFADLRYTHDYEWVFRALDRGASVVFDADARTLSYRLHGGNTILESPIAAHRETFAVLLRAMPVLAENRAALEDLSAHLARVQADIEHVHTRSPQQKLVAAVRQARRALLRRRS